MVNRYGHDAETHSSVTLTNFLYYINWHHECGILRSGSVTVAYEISFDNRRDLHRACASVPPCSHSLDLHQNRALRNANDVLRRRPSLHWNSPILERRMLQKQSIWIFPPRPTETAPNHVKRSETMQNAAKPCKTHRDQPRLKK